MEFYNGNNVPQISCEHGFTSSGFGVLSVQG